MWLFKVVVCSDHPIHRHERVRILETHLNTTQSTSAQDYHLCKSCTYVCLMMSVWLMGNNMSIWPEVRGLQGGREEWGGGVSVRRVRTSAGLPSESGPVWDDSSHRTQTQTHILMTTGVTPARITMSVGFTKQYTPLDDAD